MKTAIIIGGNRGIGLGFVRQYLEDNFKVIATYRNEHTLEALSKLIDQYPETLSLYKLEITNIEEVIRFSQTITRVDILILNAGVRGSPSSRIKPSDNSEEHLLNALKVNTIAPDNIIRSLYLVISQQQDACIVYISSLLGQTADNSSGRNHPYRISKAAANALIWDWCIELMNDWKQNHIDQLAHSPCAIAICPGWVRTDMTSHHARLSVDESVSAMRSVIEWMIRTKKCNGLYMYDGRVTEKYPIPPVLQEILACHTTTKCIGG